MSEESNTENPYEAPKSSVRPQRRRAGRRGRRPNRDYASFWAIRGATPGKLILGIRIVDRNGDIPGVGACFGRYIGYLLSSLICGLGYFWMLWDDESQCWHDKIVSTYVVR